MNQIKYAPTTSLKPHPLNATIYGDGCDQELLDSIKEKGIVNPILVTKSFQIISGHRRFNAAQMTGLNEVPVIIMEQDDPIEIEELLIVTNKQRNKTTEQIAREYEKLKDIEKEKAKRRMLSGKNDPMQNSAQGIENGAARKIAAEKLGVSHDTAEKAAKVVHHVDALRSEGKTEEAESLRQTLNQKSVNAAYQSIKAKKEPPKPETEGKTWCSPEPIEEKTKLDTETRKLRKRIEELLDNDRGRLRLIDGLKEENKSLRARIDELESLKAELESIKERIDTVEKENAKLLEEEAQSQKNNDDKEETNLREELQQYKTYHANALKKIEELQAKIDEMAKAVCDASAGTGSTVPLLIHKKLAREKAILEEKLAAAKKKNPQVDTPQIGNEELKQEVERLKAELAEIKKAPQAEEIKKMQIVLK